MSIYSAYYDSLAQKERVLANANNHIGVIKDFIATVKLDYLIYGKVVFTDAQIFDGAVIHLMLQDGLKYFRDFVDFMLYTPPGAIVIRHGMDLIGERIQYCIQNTGFELSSLVVYSEEIVQEVQNTRANAVERGLIAEKTINGFYYNIWLIRTMIEEKSLLLNHNNLSSWKNNNYMLSYFTDNELKHNAFIKTITQFRDHDKLKPITDIVLPQFNPKITSLPLRSAWKIELDAVIDNASDELLNQAQVMQKYLSNCYITLCAYQHGCFYSSLTDPFNLNEIGDTDNVENHFKGTTQFGFGLHVSVFTSLGEESLVDFSNQFRRESVQKYHSIWLDNLMSKNDIDQDSLAKLFMQTLLPYYTQSELIEKIQTWSDTYLPPIAVFIPPVAFIHTYGTMIIKLIQRHKNNRVVNIRAFSDEITECLNMQSELYGNQMRTM
ncbi:hypothetical protein MASR1M36_16050 [Candidatus Cloacimonadaceae bacterium]